MRLATTPSPVCGSLCLTLSRVRRYKVRRQDSGQQEKRSCLQRDTKKKAEVTVIEHTKDCLLEEAGQCTCDAMTDKQIDDELLEKEEAKD